MASTRGLEGADATASALENFEVFKALFESFTSKTSERRGAAGERGHTGYGMIMPPVVHICSYTNKESLMVGAPCTMF